MSFLGMQKKILKYFPVPRYLRIPSVGIDISDNSIKWMALIRGVGGKTMVSEYGSEKLPEGLVVDGVIQEPEKLSAVLKALKEKKGFQYVRASLPEEKAFLFSLAVPVSVPEHEIRDLISFTLEDHVPLSPQEVVFDYAVATYPLPQKQKKKTAADDRSVVVSVFPRNLADAYADIFFDADLVPLSFEIEAQAIARAVVHEGDAGTYMVVDFGRARSGLSIVSGGVVVFTTTIGIGGDVLTKSVQKAFPDADTKKVERIKREQGCLPNEAHKELCMSLISVVTALKDEINRHLVYWQSHEKQTHQDSVKKILLCGGNANLAGLAEYLQTALKVETLHANVWANTTFLKNDDLPPIDKHHSLGYAPAIGLALHETKNV